MFRAALGRAARQYLKIIGYRRQLGRHDTVHGSRVAMKKVSSFKAVLVKVCAVANRPNGYRHQFASIC